MSLAAVAKVLQDGFLRNRNAFHLLIPTRTLGELFGTRTAEQLQSSAITGVHTWWDRRWLELPHAAIVGRLCQWVFPKGDVIRTNTIPEKTIPPQPGAASTSTAQAEHYYQIVISATSSHRRCQTRELAAQIQGDLGEVFPAARDAKLLRYQVVTDPQAVFSISPESYDWCPDPQVTSRLMLAGDWTATGWPATMEGAVLSGFRAAEQLLRFNNEQPANIVCPPLAH